MKILDNILEIQDTDILKEHRAVIDSLSGKNSYGRVRRRKILLYGIVILYCANRIFFKGILFITGGN